MGKPWENGMLGEVGNVGMANMERSHHFSWENSLFRLGHGFNSYVSLPGGIGNREKKHESSLNAGEVRTFGSELLQCEAPV